MMPTIKRTNERKDMPTTGPYSTQKLTVASVRLRRALNVKRNIPKNFIVIWVFRASCPKCSVRDRRNVGYLVIIICGTLP